MKVRFFSLLLGALVVSATMLPTAQAQVCMTDSFGYIWEMQLSNNAFTGSVDISDTVLWDVAGARGTTSSTRRHHQFTALNPDRGDAPGCDDGAGLADWLTLNGRVVGVSGGVYAYEGNAQNSCFSNVFPFTADITFGACLAPRSTQVAANHPAMSSAPQLDAGASTIDDNPTRLSAFPNPAVDQASISFEIPAAADVRVSVYDVLGREVAVVLDEAREAGSHTVVFDASSLPAGAYVYRVQAGAYSASERLVLAH